MISEADIERLKAKAEAIAEQIKAEKVKQREEKRARAQQKATRARELKKLERRSARSTCDVRVAKTRALERTKCAKKKTRPAPTKAKGRKSAARRIKPRPVAPGARVPEMLGEVVRPKALPPRGGALNRFVAGQSKVAALAKSYRRTLSKPLSPTSAGSLLNAIHVAVIQDGHRDAYDKRMTPFANALSKGESSAVDAAKNFRLRFPGTEAFNPPLDESEAALENLVRLMGRRVEEYVDMTSRRGRQPIALLPTMEKRKVSGVRPRKGSAVAARPKQRRRAAAKARLARAQRQPAGAPPPVIRRGNWEAHIETQSGKYYVTGWLKRPDGSFSSARSMDRSFKRPEGAVKAAEEWLDRIASGGTAAASAPRASGRAVALYRGGIHGLTELAVRDDGQVYQRYQDKTPRGYRWGAWNNQNRKMDVADLPMRIESGFSTLSRVLPLTKNLRLPTGGLEAPVPKEAPPKLSQPKRGKLERARRIYEREVAIGEELSKVVAASPIEVEAKKEPPPFPPPRASVHGVRLGAVYLVDVGGKDREVLITDFPASGGISGLVQSTKTPIHITFASKSRRIKGMVTPPPSAATPSFSLAPTEQTRPLAVKKSAAERTVSMFEPAVMLQRGRQGTIAAPPALKLETQAAPDERSREARGRPMTVEARYDSENDWPIVTINNWAGPSGIAGDVRATWPPNAAEGVAVLRRESGEAEILKGADLHAAMSIALPKMALLVKKELVEDAGPRSGELTERLDRMSGKKKPAKKRGGR